MSKKVMIADKNAVQTDISKRRGYLLPSMYLSPKLSVGRNIKFSHKTVCIDVS